VAIVRFGEVAVSPGPALREAPRIDTFCKKMLLFIACHCL
jgi:hypothetical protein